ncbi:MAG: hypothetical protein ACXWP5_05645 [Bdellovibrionota bacterium]
MNKINKGALAVISLMAFLPSFASADVTVNGYYQQGIRGTLGSDGAGASFDGGLVLNFKGLSRAQPQISEKDKLLGIVKLEKSDVSAIEMEASADAPLNGNTGFVLRKADVKWFGGSDTKTTNAAGEVDHKSILIAPSGNQYPINRVLYLNDPALGSSMYMTGENIEINKFKGENGGGASLSSMSAGGSRERHSFFVGAGYASRVSPRDGKSKNQFVLARYEGLKVWCAGFGQEKDHLLCISANLAANLGDEIQTDLGTGVSYRQMMADRRNKKGQAPWFVVGADATMGAVVPFNDPSDSKVSLTGNVHIGVSGN